MAPSHPGEHDVADAYFTTATLDFLQDLEVNNDKTWFEANRDRYEADVKAPMLQFIEDLQAPLRTVSRHVVADPRVQGGSMFRIHRDLRFSSDPTPYKTNASAHFSHDQGSDVHAPGFYFQLEPGNCGMAAGIWQPPTAVLNRIRTTIVERPGAWTRARNAVCTDGWELTREGSLRRAPRGFAPDDPHIEDLRLTSIAAWRHLEEDEVTSDDLLPVFVEQCRHTLPLMRLLCRALDLPF
jgi:uncharacterized protein (TIGR02453 family)